MTRPRWRPGPVDVPEALRLANLRSAALLGDARKGYAQQVLLQRIGWACFFAVLFLAGLAAGLLWSA